MQKVYIIYCLSKSLVYSIYHDYQKKSSIRILRELNIPILLHRVQTRRVQ